MQRGAFPNPACDDSPRQDEYERIGNVLELLPAAENCLTGLLACVCPLYNKSVKTHISWPYQQGIRSCCQCSLLKHY